MRGVYVLMGLEAGGKGSEGREREVGGSLRGDEVGGRERKGREREVGGLVVL